MRRILPALIVALNTTALGAQIIQVKTLPIADGDQWRLFPSANAGIGDVSIALRDSLLDPFGNPAKASRLKAHSRGLVFGSPSVYSMSKRAGGGQTLPVGGIKRFGSMFAGAAVAIQQIDRSPDLDQFFGPTASLVRFDGTPIVTERPSRRNQFGFATLGRVFDDAGVSIGVSALWSGLHGIDGVDQLYAGSRSVAQHGRTSDVRVGALKEWSGDRTFEALVLHNRFDMAHDVTWADNVWDPNTRTFAQRARIDHNLDRTNLWGMQLGYSQPFADSGWRMGAMVTTNLMSHPKLPDYQIAQAMVIPWDPGHTAAYDLGVGVSRAFELTRFGIDAIYEPIHTHTWGETPTDIGTGPTIIPAGNKTTENWFHFSNAILRTGVSQELPLDSLRVALRGIRLEGGVAMRAVSYKLTQIDHVAGTSRLDHEDWIEWTRTWGLGVRFSGLEVRYTGRSTTGTGRTGVREDFDGRVLAAADAGASNFLSAPTSSTQLTGVSVFTHQVSVSLPIR
jgi:hypothetical protein